MSHLRQIKYQSQLVFKNDYARKIQIFDENQGKTSINQTNPLHEPRNSHIADCHLSNCQVQQDEQDEQDVITGSAYL